jgi:hypothetical protein
VTETVEKPRIVEAYRIYCSAVTWLFGLGAMLGPWFIFDRASFARDVGVDPTAFGIFGMLWLCTMLFLAFVHIAARVTPPSPFAWRIHAVVLAIGLTTVILWPLALPILWKWMKPDVRAYFGVEAA